MWIVNGVSQLCFLAEKMERKGQNNVADGSQENEKGKRKSKFVFVKPEKAKRARETQQSRGSYQKLKILSSES